MFIPHVGTIYESKSYKWKFAQVDLPHESYAGVNAKLRYFVRLSLARPYSAMLTKEVEFSVQNPVVDISVASSIKMEVRHTL